MGDRQIVCLTPVKNEEWVLEKFLRCTSRWADKIIIADQLSTDRSVEIANSFKKVTLIRNDSIEYNEGDRQRLLISEARKIPGEKVLVTLDADEIISGNYQSSGEWQELYSAPIGTVFGFKWINLYPDYKRCWIPNIYFPWGFVDDGRSEHIGQRIHSKRMPVPHDAPLVEMEDITVLHLQYTDWERMKSKQRWYQVWEWLHNDERSPTRIYRKYHHMDTIENGDVSPVMDKWFESYVNAGIEIRETITLENYHWDREILSIMEERGAKTLERIPIWEVDWRGIARRQGIEEVDRYGDPRALSVRALHWWLEATQRFANRRVVKMTDYGLQVCGW